MLSDVLCSGAFQKCMTTSDGISATATSMVQVVTEVVPMPRPNRVVITTHARMTLVFVSFMCMFMSELYEHPVCKAVLYCTGAGSWINLE